MYRVFLKFIGYSLYRNKYEEKNVNIIKTSDGNILPTYNIKIDKTYKSLLILKILYNFMILLSISWISIFSIILIFIENNMLYINESFLHFIFTIQYIIGIYYMNKDHIYNKFKNEKNIAKKISIFFCISTFIALVLSIIEIIFVIYNVKITSILYIYQYYNNNNLFLIFLFISKFYSYTSFLINASIFVVIIANHRYTITQYTEKVKLYISSSVSMSNKISTISLDMINMRSEYDKTVSELNTMFSSLCVLTLFYILCVINIYLTTNLINVFDIINIIFFIFIVYIYIYFVQILRKSIDLISKNIRSQFILNNYLHRNETNDTIELTNDYNNKNIYDMMTRCYINIVNVKEGISWTELQKILELKWESFEILGINIDDSMLIQKIIRMLVLILIAKNLFNISPLF